MKSLAMIVCALVTAAPALAQDASGKWQLTVTTPQREPRTTSMVLKKDGDKLSGTLIGAEGQELALAGTQTGADVTLSFTAPTQNGPIAVSMKGRQDGESMKGTLQIGTEGQGEWTAGRTAAPAARPSGTSAVDLTGTWAFQVVIEGGTRTPTVIFKQDGEKLSGTYKSQLGEVPLTGQIKDKDFSFQVTLTLEGNPITIVYTGAVDGNAVSGRVSAGEFGTGTFTGKKQDSGGR
jgi:hypothetical protein